MISPLQTWKHQEHKALWPVLGGLAVLTHVGVIGLSVPYLLSWQAAGARRDAAAIPIELVAVSVETEELETGEERSDGDRVSPQNSQPSVESKPTSEQAVADVPVSQPLGDAAAGNAITQTSSDLVAEAQEEELEKNPEESPVAEPPINENSATSDDNSEVQNESAEPEDTTEREPDDSVDEVEASEPSEQPEELLQAAESEEVETSPTEEIPTIEGSDALPTPSTSTEAGQSLQIRAVGAPVYDPVEDFESAPPELIDTDYVGLFRPEAEGCGEVSAAATQGALVYRIAVGEDGSIFGASLQEGGAIAPGSTDDLAVQCLIQKTGIAFSRPESDEGTKPIDDSLLMTFELSEQ